MKKRWVYMLSLLLAIALTAFGAAAETGMDLTLSIEEEGSATLPEEIEVSVDGLEIEGEALDIQVPVGEDFQLEDLNLSDLADPAVARNAGISQAGEEQLTPVTEDPMLSNADDFEIDENGVLVKYKGPGGDVVIPSRVTKIDKNAFDRFQFLNGTVTDPLTSVVIPEGVTDVSTALSYTDITQITIPEGVTSLSVGAFFSCYKLEKVSLPSSLTSIGSSAFNACMKLTSINMPESVTSIGINAFTHCPITTIVMGNNALPVRSWCNDIHNLKSVTIIDGTNELGDNLFSGWSGLTSITLPDTITKIGKNVFANCTSLPTIAMPKGLTDIGDETFRNCSSLTNLVLPDGISEIADSVFYGCTNLSSVTLPDSVTSIGASAFRNCTSLSNIRLPGSLTRIGASAFSGCTGLKDITIPTNVVNIGESAFNGCGSLMSIAIPNGVTIVGESAFSGCSSLTSVTLPDSITSIGNYAFSDCGSLGTIAIPNGVTSIADSVFSGCVNLASITIPSSVMSIGVSAFSGCIGLTSITIPDGVTSIGSGAFSGCSGLTSIRIPGNVASVSADAFAGCNSATMYIYNPGNVIRSHAFENITLPGLVIESGAKVIDEYAFFGWSKLQTVTLPDTLTEIREGAFERCGMMEITIPRNVKKLGVAAFFDCRQLRTITFNSRLTAVGREAFFGCRKLSTIIINENMTDICDGMFKECEGITRIDIPETVGIIGNSAFESCSGLSSTIIGGAFGEPSSNAKAARKVAIGTKAFKGCGGMKKIVIPPSVTRIADDAFEGCMRLTIYGQKGSYAHEYARKHDIPFKEAKQAKRIAISQGKKMTLYMGNKLTLRVKLKPANASAALKWISSNKKIATVDMQGVVTPIRAGKTVITVKTDNGLSAKITINVVDASGIKIKEGKSKTLKKGGNLKLHAIVSPGKVKTKLIWSSSDNRVATVSKTGKVKARQVGTVVITVKTENGKKAKIKITVQ